MSWKARGDRVRFSTAEKKFILRRDEGVCHVCGQPGADQADHVVPIAEDGPHHVDNGAPIHSEPCHRIKSREESRRGYLRRESRRKLPPEPRPFDTMMPRRPPNADAEEAV